MDCIARLVKRVSNRRLRINVERWMLSVERLPLPAPLPPLKLKS
jgi:hypothetical protein